MVDREPTLGMPDDEFARLQRQASQLYVNAQHEEAAAIYERLHAARPDNKKVKVQYTKILREQGYEAYTREDYDASREFYERAIEVDPDIEREVMDRMRQLGLKGGLVSETIWRIINTIRSK